ncbi:hypothetical protein JXQ31_14095 [candidate division KSB1 bacterium]|nr:hypothetical protein [candidate division KSB1 bacterium]
MSKKKKKVIAKRRVQAKANKQRKEKPKIKYRRSASNIAYEERPAIAAIDAPPGFRSVSMSQGLMEFAKPMMEFVEKGTVKELNDVFQLALPIWNYDIALEKSNSIIDKKDIIKPISKILKLNAQESAEFFDMMIQRKQHLFPKEIQPADPLIVYLKKEEHYHIKEFNYNSLNISKEIYLPAKEDNQLVQLLNQIDDYINKGTEYDEWEDFYFKMVEKCKKRYKTWLEFKGLKEFSEEFPYNIEIYLNFIYCYFHEDEINLKKVKAVNFVEFFTDYVLRKVMAEPQEYITWPPSIKLFYSFLKEICYFDTPEKVIKLVDDFEPIFVKIIKVRYS